MLLFRVRSWPSAKPKRESLMKDLLALIAAVQPVVAHLTDRSPCGSRSLSRNGLDFVGLAGTFFRFVTSRVIPR